MLPLLSLEQKLTFLTEKALLMFDNLDDPNEDAAAYDVNSDFVVLFLPLPNPDGLSSRSSSSFKGV